MAQKLCLSKQTVRLNLGKGKGQITGSTDIDFELVSDFSPKVIMLNARQMTINSVQISGSPCEFTHFDAHNSFDYEIGPLMRDTTHFAAVCEIANNTPDLIINLTGPFPLTVHIDFTLDPSNTALVNMNQIIYTDNRLAGPSSWFPCIDTLGQRTEYTLEVTYPQKLICIGPGESKLIAHDTSGGTYTMRYTVPYAIQPHFLGFAVGPFTQSSIGSDSPVNLFYPPNEEQIRHGLKGINQLINDTLDGFNRSESRMDPLSIVHIPFLTEPLQFPRLILFPPSLVCPHANVLANYEIIPQIVELLVNQTILFQFPVSNPADLWIPTGIAAFMADMIAAKTYSMSFAHDRRWNDIDNLFVEDIHPTVVLSAIDPATGDPFKDPYLKTKSKLLVSSIATPNTRTDPLNLLVDTIAGILASCKDSRGFAAEKFYVEVSKNLPHLKMKIFKQQWVNSNGMPIFTYNFTTDQRNNTIKFVMYQTPSCKTNVQCFTGQISVQVRDLEQPIDTKFAVENQLVQQTIQYIARKKKTKKKTFVFVNNESQEVLVRSAVLFICLDHSNSWVARIRPRVPCHHLVNQLLLLRHVYTQHQAISALRDYAETQEATDILARILRENSCYFGVRAHAARALGYFANIDGNFSNVDILATWYREKFFGSIDSPSPSMSYDTGSYIVSFDVLKALSIIRDQGNHTPQPVIALFCQAIESYRSLDNTSSNAFFVSECELSIGRLRPEREEDLNNLVNSIISLIGSPTEDYKNMVISSGYLSLTSLSAHYPSVPLEVTEMRKKVIQKSQFYECRAIIFKCLLYLAYSEKGVTFADLISDVYLMCKRGEKEMAAKCLREVYRFINNMPKVGSEDKFEAYLLAFPADSKPADIVKKLLGKNEQLEIAETLWTIMTKEAKYHKILRSEGLRAYTALYGASLPQAFSTYEPKPLGYELTAEKSSGIMINIEPGRITNRGGSQASTLPKGKRIVKP